MIEIRIRKAERIVRRVDIKRRSVSIGSAEGSGIRVRSMEPRHASLHFEEDGLVLMSLEGEVRLNGRITHFARPQPHDVIQVGRISFSALWTGPAPDDLVLPDPEPYEPPTLALVDPPDAAPQEEEEDDRPADPFDLARELMEASPRLEAPDGELMAHLLWVYDGSVRETIRLFGGAKGATDWGDLRAAFSDGRLILNYAGDLSGRVLRGDSQQHELVADPTSEARREVELTVGQTALLAAPEGQPRRGQWRVDVTRSAAPARRPGARLTPLALLAGLLALVLHLGLGATLSVFAPEPQEPGEKTLQEESFAVVEMTSRRETNTEPPPTTRQLAEKSTTVSNRDVRQASTPPPDTTVESLLASLSQSSGASAESSAIRSVSNIAAVPTLTAGFDLTGALSKLSGTGVSVARRPGTAIATASSAESGQAAALKSSGPSGRVRGRVTRLSSQIKIAGTLSREEISQVVNRHIHEVQRCYERELLVDVSLSGRILYEWTVTGGGAVSGVRTKSSTMRSPQVADCIAAAIRTWQFTQPEGGDVVVAYPFLFRSASG